MEAMESHLAEPPATSSGVSAARHTLLYKSEVRLGDPPYLPGLWEPVGAPGTTLITARSSPPDWSRWFLARRTPATIPYGLSSAGHPGYWSVDEEGSQSLSRTLTLFYINIWSKSVDLDLDMANRWDESKIPILRASSVGRMGRRIRGRVCSS